MPVTLASCLGLTSDALGACPHDYTAAKIVIIDETTKYYDGFC